MLQIDIIGNEIYNSFYILVPLNEKNNFCCILLLLYFLSFSLYLCEQIIVLVHLKFRFNVAICYVMWSIYSCVHKIEFKCFARSTFTVEIFALSDRLPCDCMRNLIHLTLSIWPQLNKCVFHVVCVFLLKVNHISTWSKKCNSFIPDIPKT